MLINFSLTRLCVQKMQMLAHGRVSNKLKAAALSPFAGIALPFGDACMHTALAILKTPFLVAPLNIGRLAGKGFVSSLDRRSPRHALLSQMAFHVVRGLASLTLLAVSTLAIPTIPFLVIMPRVVSKTHDRLGLNRLFKTRIALKPPVKPVAIVNQVPHIPVIPTPIPTPLAKIVAYVPPQQVAPSPMQLSKPEVLHTPVPVVQMHQPPSQLPPAPIKAPPSAPANPTTASIREAEPAQNKQTKGKVQKRVGLPSPTTQRPPKSETHRDADRIKQLCKRALSKTKHLDSLPMAPLTAAPIPTSFAVTDGNTPPAAAAAAIAVDPLPITHVTTAAPIPTSAAVSQGNMPPADAAAIAVDPVPIALMTTATPTAASAAVLHENMTPAVAAAVVTVDPLPIASITTAAPTAISTAVSQGNMPPAAAAAVIVAKTNDAESIIDINLLAAELESTADDLGRIATNSLGNETSLVSTSSTAQNDAKKVRSRFQQIKKRPASAASQEASSSTEATPKTSPRGSSSETPVSIDPGKAQSAAAKVRHAFRAVKPIAAAPTNNLNPTIASILAEGQTAPQQAASAPAVAADAKKDGSKVKHLIKSAIRRKPADENLVPAHQQVPS